jgi:hypothetical protein
VETAQGIENSVINPQEQPPKIDAPKTTELLCCEKPLEFIVQKGSGSYVPEIANCPTCKAYFERKPKSEVAYKSINDGKSYSCTKCGGEIQVGKIAYPIWDGPGPMSGSGRCEYERVPYCPKCEKEPNFHGTPIEVK